MASILEQLLDNKHLVVGISELSNMTGTSPRQLRYWEQKGWIAAIPDEQHAARRYQLPAVVKAELIKKFLDEGFTLKKAAEKAEARLKKVSHVQTVLPNILHDVKVIDDRFTIFSLGAFEPKNERLILLHDSELDTLRYHIIPMDEVFDYTTLCHKLNEQ